MHSQGMSIGKLETESELPFFALYLLLSLRHESSSGRECQCCMAGCFDIDEGLVLAVLCGIPATWTPFSLPSSARTCSPTVVESGVEPYPSRGPKPPFTLM